MWAASPVMPSSGRSASASRAGPSISPLRLPADVLNAMFDRDDALLRPGDDIPLGRPWYYFPELMRLAGTDEDGHAAKGGFLPSVPLPFRMWAGVPMTFHRPIRVGERLARTAPVAGVTVKEVRSGPRRGGVLRHLRLHRRVRSRPRRAERPAAGGRA